MPTSNSNFRMRHHSEDTQTRWQSGFSSDSLPESKVVDKSYTKLFSTGQFQNPKDAKSLSRLLSKRIRKFIPKPRSGITQISPAAFQKAIGIDLAIEDDNKLYHNIRRFTRDTCRKRRIEAKPDLLQLQSSQDVINTIADVCLGSSDTLTV